MKSRKLTKSEKALLEVLIHEILNSLPDVAINKKVRKLLETWVKENDLHPEQCITIRPTEEELIEFHEKYGK